MYKRILCSLFALGFLFSSIVAHADAVWGNDFLDEHREETQSLDRSRFCVNGADGYVIPQQVPGEALEEFTSEHSWASNNGSPVLLPKFQNGSELILGQVYIHDGEYWGAMHPSHSYSWPGWVAMDQMLAVYIPADFDTEHKDDFQYAYTGNTESLLEAKRLVLWQWPGSDREKRVFESMNSVIDISVLHTYRDTDSREWGYISVKYRPPNWNSGATQAIGWVCLTDPANSDIPSSYPAPPPTKWSPDGTFTWTHVTPPKSTVTQYDLTNISKIRAYDEAFADVTQNMWYHGAVTTAYEYAIIEGIGKNKFNPYGALTGGEALAIASRIHARYKYGQEEGNRLINEVHENYYIYGMNMWGGTITYCRLEGLVDREFIDYFDAFDDYDNFIGIPITRAKMVHAWSKILQSKDMAKQNTVSSLPDVNENTPYAEDIRLFYEAGILGGVNTIGTFNPDAHITRAEAAAIFMRLIDPSARISGRTYGD